MHLYFLTRGVKHARDLFISQMQSQFFSWKRKNLKTNKEEITFVQGALRPVELWEYVFPEEALPDVLAMMNIDPKRNQPIFDKARLKILQKSLGAKPIPKNLPKAEIKRILISKGVSSHPIGIKKDRRAKVPEWGFEQEML